MSVSRKREAALAILESSGIRRSNYAPPLVRFLWKMGFDVPPPHFGGFFANVLLTGTVFAIAWGLVMWAALWSRQGFAPFDALIIASCAGVLFGLSMGAYYAYSGRKHQLPRWTEL